MKGFNQVILLGNLTRDPELRTTPNGQSVCSFSIAVNAPTKEGQEPRADFVDCVAWGKQAEIISGNLEKGKPILVDGRLTFRSWEKDGEKRSKLEVTVNDFNFVGDKKPETESPF